MTDITAENAIEDRLRAFWTATPIAVQNEGFTPPVDVNGDALPFIEIEFPGAVGTLWGIGDPGNNSWRDDGVFQILICVPTGWGARLARQYAKDIAAIYRGQSFAESVVCFAPFPPRAGRTEDGTYYVMTLPIPYAFQFLA